MFTVHSESSALKTWMTKTEKQEVQVVREGYAGSGWCLRRQWSKHLMLLLHLAQHRKENCITTLHRFDSEQVSVLGV